MFPKSGGTANNYSREEQPTLQQPRPAQASAASRNNTSSCWAVKVNTSSCSAVKVNTSSCSAVNTSSCSAVINPHVKSIWRSISQRFIAFRWNYVGRGRTACAQKRIIDALETSTWGAQANWNRTNSDPEVLLSKMHGLLKDHANHFPTRMYFSY